MEDQNADAKPLSLEDIAKGDLGGLSSSIRIVTAPKIANEKLIAFFELMHLKSVPLEEAVRIFLTIDRLIEEGKMTEDIINNLSDSPASVLPDNQEQTE
ncbi:MAG: hypothetical protein TR69_WS6001000750 [candidate division WS6 bacterium OLB20]|uniref:Uncharacterized protein n=1 Tax=candidate division WS6 bacterium OLB20 TaxID=1617426 RepID=A0A136LYL2_9BACT|nr:MAG: hypothetical protein TR69_WS6001000750 [candidate division WS6 bacterium OLB20]